MKRQVTLSLEEEDCKWLEGMYGDKWTKRMEQHIENEVTVLIDTNQITRLQFVRINQAHNWQKHRLIH